VARRAPTSHSPHSSTHPAHTAPAQTGARGGRQRRMVCAVSALCVCCRCCAVRVPPSCPVRSVLCLFGALLAAKGPRKGQQQNRPDCTRRFSLTQENHTTGHASTQHTHGARTRTGSQGDARTEHITATRLVPPCLVRLLLEAKAGVGLGWLSLTRGRLITRYIRASNQGQRSTAAYANRTQQTEITNEGGGTESGSQTEQLPCAKGFKYLIVLYLSSLNICAMYPVRAEFPVSNLG
jgi:hypothetical protein